MLGIGYSAFGIARHNWSFIEGTDTTGVALTGFTFYDGLFDEVFASVASHAAHRPKPGVQMRFITNSGGNQYRGTVSADDENRAWQAFNLDAGQIARGAPRPARIRALDTPRTAAITINGDVWLSRTRSGW